MSFEWLKQTLTGRDNVTHDIARHVGFWGALTGLAMQVYDVVMLHNAFHIQDFGVGLGILVTGVGAALGLKKDTEPPSSPLEKS